MPNIATLLSTHFRAAICAAFGEAAGNADPLVGPSSESRRGDQQEQHGDFQSNAAMSLAKRIGQKPREVAEKIKANLNLGEMASEVSVAGPGFINVKLSHAWLAKELQKLVPSASSAIPPAGSESGSKSGNTSFSRSTPSPGTPGEGRGEGLQSWPIENAPHPNPLPEYRARGSETRLGVEVVASPQTVVVDYSGPNVAKEMHVGHLRSTIIGDAISRILDFQGHTVIRRNHIGDWGTQFGRVMLGLWYESVAIGTGQLSKLNEWMANRTIPQKLDGETATQAAARRDEERKYLEPIVVWHQKSIDLDPNGIKYFAPYVNSRFPSLPRLQDLYTFATKVTSLEAAELFTINHARWGPIKLSELPSKIATFVQAPFSWDGRNEQEQIAWLKSVTITLDACDEIYEDLGVLLKRSDVVGESAYHANLPIVVRHLLDQKIAEQSAGAIVVFTDGKDKPPFIIQKSDGGYLYGTTDLAAVYLRININKAQRIIYVHDSRQAHHFAQLFAVARKAGWADGVSLEYAPFGTMLGEDGKPFKTRSGGTVKLKELLDEAEERAMAVVTAKNPDLPEEQKKSIAHAVGIGGVKYADLNKDRISDYVFSFDKMLALDGNTAPYLQYAHARIASILAKAQGTSSLGVIALESPFEITLAKHILRFPEVIEAVAGDLKPHLLCTYLYDLAVKFSGFYENCPVIQSQEPTRSSRLALCGLTAGTLKLGLDLLGIECPYPM
jgi:arginyl-tRNA synthetase